MFYYSSCDSRHCLIDFSKLVLRAHGNLNQEHFYIQEFASPYYKLGKKEHFVEVPDSLMNSHCYLFMGGMNGYYKKAFSLAEVLALFEENARKATLTNDKPKLALDLLKRKIIIKYYSGNFGWLRRILHTYFQWESKDFTAIMKKIDTISQKINTLPQKKSKSNLLKKKVTDLYSTKDKEIFTRVSKVFTDNLNDHDAIGALSGFSPKRYTVEWMSPRSYLNRVDPCFKRHSDEESIPWITEQMIKLIESDSEECSKFSPLMMDPKQKYHITENYYVLFHEGRHRALVAERLGINKIPVAIPI